MDVNTSLKLDASMYAFNQSKNVKDQEILGALGMTPQTQQAQQVIDSSIKEGVAQATGQGINIDFKA